MEVLNSAGVGQPLLEVEDAVEPPQEVEVPPVLHFPCTHFVIAHIVSSIALGILGFFFASFVHAATHVSVFVQEAAGAGDAPLENFVHMEVPVGHVPPL